MEKALVPICPSVCGNALSGCVNTWFLKWNNEEYLWLQIKTDREARKWHFLINFFTTKNGKGTGSNLSICLWERFERVCQHLIFEMKKQWRIFMTTNEDRRRSKGMTFFQPLKWKSPWSQSAHLSVFVFALSVCVSTWFFTWNSTRIDQLRKSLKI